jgi:hypothetical protein
MLDGNLYIIPIISGLLDIISFVSNLLSLQTFLFSKKIRITNLGTYLILFSLTGLIASIIRGVFHFAYIASNLKVSKLYHLIYCPCISILIESLYWCLYWFCLYIAVERVLIQYSFVSLYDSRRRSFISSILLYILIPLTNLLPILFNRKDYACIPCNCCLIRLTSICYTLYLIFQSIHYTTAPLSFTIACIVIFKHLIQHRLSLVNNESFCSSLILIASKHYDFFLPPIVFCLMTSPYFIFDKLVNYLQADSRTVFCALTVTALLSNGALALSFFIYVYLSKIYLSEFWQTSPFGRFLIYVKKQFINCCKHQIIIVDGGRPA